MSIYSYCKGWTQSRPLLSAQLSIALNNLRLVAYIAAAIESERIPLLRGNASSLTIDTSTIVTANYL